jgi:SET domain-containing protein
MKKQPYHIVRNSKIHGRGVFAKRPIRKGTKVIEYTGNIISADEADEIGAASIDGHTHTMLFSIDKDRVINGLSGGPAKYINHSCAPNCEAVQYEDQVFIESLRSIPQGEELTYDYHLEVPGKITDKVRKEYACFCGSPECRGTQIAAAILEKQARKDAEKQKEKEKKEAVRLLKKNKKAEEKENKKQKQKDRKKKKKNKKN